MSHKFFLVPTKHPIPRFLLGLQNAEVREMMRKSNEKQSRLIRKKKKKSWLTVGSYYE